MGKKATINKSGVEYSDYKEASPVFDNWHNDSCPYRLMLIEEVKKDLLAKYNEQDFLSTYPEVKMLIDLFKERDFPTFTERNTTYIYLEHVDPSHLPIIIKHQIELQENNVNEGIKRVSC